MNRPSPQRLKSWLLRQFVQVREQRFFNDKLSLAILIPSLLLNVANLIILIIRLHPTDFPVPVHYSSLHGYDELGPWYQIYGIGLFATGVTLINTAMAAVSFNRSRITSFFLNIGSFVVGLFCLVISLAFAAIV